MSKAQPEYALQKQIATYLCYQHPNALFLSDVRAALKLSITQAVRSRDIQKPGFACPDMMIFAARCGYHGLFLELKAESPYKKDGTLYAGEHLANQERARLALLKRGYLSVFVWNFDDAKRLIDDYLNGRILNDE